MKKLTIIQLEEIKAGGKGIAGFCAGFGAVAAVYHIGAWANIWNPVGQSAIVAEIVIGGACAIYALE
jgi:hypothetical protein